LLVAALDAKDKPMTRPTPDQPPEAAPTKTNVEAAARRSRAFVTFLLAAVLSGLLLVGAGTYLLMAPDPAVRSPAVRSMAQAPQRAENAITFIAPRSVIDADLLRDFETESGSVVDLVSYDNEESLLSIAAATALNADVILAAGTTIQQLQQIRDSSLSVLSARSIANLGRVDPSLRTIAKNYDPRGLYAVPYAWTSVGLALDRAALTSRLKVAQSLDSWALLFDPALVTQFSDCGVYSLDAPSLAFPSALASLGLPAFSNTPNDVERASAAWESIRQNITKFDTRTLSDALVSGKVCLALAPASDVYRARALARDAGQASNLEFIVPREGSVLRLFMLAQLRDAQNPARSAALIEYLFKPEVSARMTNTHWLANALPASQLYVRQDIKDDPSIYPDVDAFARLTPEANPTPAMISLRERFWLLMSSGAPAP
jgi:putrescine transport system substrate-binding protein